MDHDRDPLWLRILFAIMWYLAEVAALALTFVSLRFPCLVTRCTREPAPATSVPGRIRTGVRGCATMALIRRRYFVAAPPWPQLLQRRRRPS
jgi:hypothetical protein